MKRGMMSTSAADAALDEVHELAEQTAHDTGWPSIVMRPSLRGKIVAELFKPKNDPAMNQLLDADEAIDLLDRSAGRSNVFLHPKLPKSVRRKLDLIVVTASSTAGHA